MQQEKPESRWKRLDFYFQLATLLFFLVAPASLATERFTRAVDFGRQDVPLPQLEVMLFLVSLVLGFLWWSAVSHERDMLKDWGAEFVPSPPNITLLTIGFAVLLGLLAWASDHIWIYSAIFSLFKLVEVWFLWLRDQKLREALEAAYSQVPEDPRRSKWEIIETYYFNSPQLPLAVVIMFLSGIAFALGLYGELTLGAISTKVAKSAGYIVQISCILAGEAIYARWRALRDQALVS